MDIVTALAIMAGYLLILALGGVVADYILPYIRPLERWINTLPMMSNEQEDE